jgi:hypothetical protein
VAFAYLYACPYQALIHNPNENLRVYMTAAIVDHGTYAVDAPAARWGPSVEGDAAAHGGRTWSPKAPGTSLLGVPGYALLRALSGPTPPSLDAAVRALRLAGSTLPALAFLYALHRWLRARVDDPALADAALVAVALGSLLYGYALLFVSTAASAAAAFGAFMLLADARRDGAVSAPRAFAAGLLAAAVTWFEYPGLVASAALALFALAALRPRARLLPFALGAALPTLSTMHFQAVAFGSALTPGHRFSLHPDYRAALHHGLFGLDRFSPEAAARLLLDPGFGLLPTTPFLLFAPLGFVALLRQRERRPEAIAALTVCLGTWLAIACANNWRGGWTVGPRYLALTVPFLAWASVEGLRVVAARSPAVARALALGTAAASVAVSGTLSAFYPHVPPEIARPLPDLALLLARHGFAPATLANLAGVYGPASLAPLCLAAAAALAYCARRHAREPAVLLGALAVAALTVAPALSPSPSAASTDAVAFVARTWTPAGHDRATDILRRVARDPHPSREDLRTLARLYREEGRAEEAAAAGRWWRAGAITR